MSDEKATISDYVWIGGFLLALTIVLHGWATYKMWDWFLVPLGLPAINFFHAIGIYLSINFMAGYKHSLFGLQDQAEEKVLVDNLIYLYARPLSILLFGWFIHLCV